jgi:hypothetical protein
VLTNNVPPPSLMPGARYFLGVQNTNNVPATFAIEVDTQVLANPSAIIPLTVNNDYSYTNTITSAPQYYSFAVPANAILASFEIVNPTNEVDLYAEYGLPLPSNTSFDYQASYDGTNDEAIVVATNSYNILGPVTANSDPVPLTPGNWYLAVYNANTNTPVTYQVVATYITSNSITITPLADSYAIGGTNGPGPDLTNFYSYTVTNFAATGVQFVVSSMSGNVDLIARNGFLPTPQQMTDGSFNPGTTPQVITIATNALLPSLDGTTWYLGVPNNTAGPVSFLIAATALTVPPPSNFPAVRLMGMSVSASGFTLRWSAAPAAQYEVDLSSDLIRWTKAATITTSGSTGAYTDPNLHQPARFYVIVRTR